MRRPQAAIVVVLVGSILLAAGCGGGGGAGEDGTTSSATGETMESLWRGSGENVGAVAGTSDFQVGTNRISFLVVDKQGRVSARPTARIWVSHGLKQTPFAETTARLEPIGVPGGETADAGAIYVARIKTPSPGTYWYLAKPLGGPEIGALGNVVVRQKSAAPSVGDKAVPSRTPTLASTGGDLTELTTARHPDPGLYRSSVAQALAAHAPFVLSFATPEFCQSRTCGPVVDVVSAVHKREPADSPVRFIHVEIYTDNDPANGVNQWVKQWRLPTEPFTYVVDRTGVIRTKLEGAFSAGELERAVAAVR
jgi:predicted small secreted protein